MSNHAAADSERLNLAEFENQRVGDMILLGVGLAHVELARLAVMIGESLRPDAKSGAVLFGGERVKSVLGRLARTAGLAGPGVRLVVHASFGIGRSRHMAVLLKMSERALGRVDRDMREVGATEPLELCIEIGEVPALEQRIVAEVDAGHDVLSAKSDLLGLGEEIVDAAVEHEAADAPHRHFLFGYDLRGIEHVEIEFVREIFIEELKSELPFGIVARLDRIPEIPAMEVGVGAVDLDGFVPYHRLEPKLGLPMKLDEGRLSGRIDEAKSMDAEPFHEAEGAWNRSIRHNPHDHVHAFRR